MHGSVCLCLDVYVWAFMTGAYAGSTFRLISDFLCLTILAHTISLDFKENRISDVRAFITKRGCSGLPYCGMGGVFRCRLRSL